MLGAGFVQTFKLRSLTNLPLDLSYDSFRPYHFHVAAEYTQKYYPSYRSADSADDIISRSDCVLRIRVNPDTEIMGYNFLASADVVSVLWGEVPADNRVYVFESVRLSNSVYGRMEFNSLGGIELDGAANKLVPGNEYVVCLKKLDFAKGSFSPEHDGRMYMYTDEICSAFPCGHEPVYGVYSAAQLSEANKAGDPILYGDVCECDYVANKSIIGGAKYLYESMLEKFGREAFGLPLEPVEPHETPQPERPPEQGTVEWIAYEMMRRWYLGIVNLKLQDFSDILERNGDTVLFFTANVLDQFLLVNDSEKYLVKGVPQKAEIVKIISETDHELKAQVRVVSELEWSIKEDTVETEFIITVDKERMVATAYDEPETSESYYNVYLKPAYERYLETLPWDQAGGAAFDEVFELLAGVVD